MVWVVVAEGVAIALLGVLVLGLLRSHALILRALHELGAGLELEKEVADAGGSGHDDHDHAPPGAVPVQIEPGVVPGRTDASNAAHDVIGEDLSGRHSVVEVGSTGSTPTLLAFLSSGCSVCQTYWDEFGPDTATPADARLVVVTKGRPDEAPATLARLANPGVRVVASSAAWADYDIPGSPYFVLVEDGIVTGEGSATSWPQVRDLLEQAVEQTAHARLLAGRTGPGSFGDPGPGGRDDLSRIDAELLAAGIQPGHASLHTPPDPDEAAEPRG